MVGGGGEVLAHRVALASAKFGLTGWAAFVEGVVGQDESHVAGVLGQ